ncbi:hypothetical protein ACWEFL_02640 [Streptomyces sp. NPDC004838]
MPDTPYTEDDLRAEAARQHRDLTRDHDAMGVGEQMDGESIPSTVIDLEPETGEPLELCRAWSHLTDDDFDAAQRSIHGLITGAADTSAWAIALGATGLAPGPSLAYQSTTAGTYDVAVHVATGPHLRDAARDELLAELADAISATVTRVLRTTVVVTRTD